MPAVMSMCVMMLRNPCTNLQEKSNPTPMSANIIQRQMKGFLHEWKLETFPSTLIDTSIKKMKANTRDNAKLMSAPILAPSRLNHFFANNRSLFGIIWILAAYLTRERAAANKKKDHMKKPIMRKMKETP